MTEQLRDENQTDESPSTTVVVDDFVVGASRARDVSHSRPHRVRKVASFDPVERYVDSVETVVRRALIYGAPMFGGSMEVMRCDARALAIRSETIDLILTSPPYLTAIDYLRGHRMSLVWMGHTISALRKLRGENIGSERSAVSDPRLQAVVSQICEAALSSRMMGILNRYILDLDKVISEIARVLKIGAIATLVVADATVAGRVVDIARATRLLAESNGLTLVKQENRNLPSARRYLPTPGLSSSNSLARRMRVEAILTMRR